MPRKYRIAVVPGDGIGPEVVRQAQRILDKTAELIRGLHLEFEIHEAGAKFWLKNGRRREWDPETFERCKDADAIFLGAIGLPGATYSDGRAVGGEVVFGLRLGLDLYANVRPVKLLEGT